MKLLTSRCESSPASFRRVLILLTFGVGGLLNTIDATAVAQVFIARRDWGAFQSATTPVSAQIVATAEFVRAAGEANRNSAAARKIRAQAVAQEIRNAKEWVKAYLEIRELREAERLKQYLSLHDRLEKKNRKTWELLRDNPEVNTATIVSGADLNFLLDRLAVTVLAYQFSLGADSSTLDQNENLRLDPRLRHGLQAQRMLPNGKHLKFRIDQEVQATVEHWPFLLRAPEFDDVRTRYDQARAAAINAKRTGMDDSDSISRLAAAYDELDAAFSRRFDTRTYLKEVQAKKSAFIHDHSTARNFIKSLMGEVLEIKESGPRVVEDELKFEGSNVIALLTHMSRNGLRFAPAEPGDEPAYHQVFHMMRDMYNYVGGDGGSGTPNR